ncbi:HK97 family phage prohead protease [Parasphingorhabdus sp.]|uniref:HK97 family phage prohead protease n=1 Tax=Parasphingorhabdus sp. TaxID=2709688 RepID=UPI0030012FFB
MTRAYSVLTIKGIDPERREISGIATTPTLDQVGDSVEPLGGEFALPLPFLWQHDHDKPIGHVTQAKATAAGIEFVAKLVAGAEPGKLKDRLDEAWHSIKSGLVRGVSIGFMPLESEPLKTGGRRFTRWAWHELSAVTIACNGEASIAQIKSADMAQRKQHRVVKLDARPKHRVVKLSESDWAKALDGKPVSSALLKAIDDCDTTEAKSQDHETGLMLTAGLAATARETDQAIELIAGRLDQLEKRP